MYYVLFLTDTFDVKSIFGNDDLAYDTGFSKNECNLKNEYLRD